MDGPFTIGLPPTTQAQIDGLLSDLRLTVKKWGTVADKYAALADSAKQSLPGVNAALDAVSNAVKEIADAVKGFKFTGPMGIHGQSN
jgi:hypothetical protein